MRVKVISVIQLPNKDKTVLKPGEGMIHTIDDDLMSHWFIQGKIDNGEMIIVTEENQKQKELPYNRPKVAISAKVVEILPKAADDKLVVPKVEVNYIDDKKEKEVQVETKVEEVKVKETKINKRK